MKWFYNLKIGKKVMVGFSIVILITIILGLISVISLNSITKLSNRNNTNNKQLTALIDKARVAQVSFKIQVQEWKNTLLRGEAPESFSKYKKSFLDQQENVRMLLNEIKTESQRKNITDCQQLIDDTIKAHNELGTKYMAAIEGIAAINKDDIDKIDAAVKGIDRAPTELFDKIVLFITEFTDKIISDEEKEFTSKTTSTNILIIICIILGIAVSIVLSLFISRIIKKPILQIVGIASRISNGDLDIKLNVFSKDETGDMMRSFSAMIENIRSLSLEMNMLTKFAIEGKLDKRGNSGKFNGTFSEIVTGVNNILNAVIEPIQEATSVLGQMSKGNFDTSVEGDYKGDHALIKNSLNSTIYSINEVLTQINNSSDHVSSGANQVAVSGQALSSGSTEQASSIEEITSSMTQVAVQTKQNALNANQANELAITAKENAISGNRQMKEMLKSMQEINESSASISKIIKVIDEIAFQTNILALNAAVEAARAGQHGKGFAVVAEEVRNLAARSAYAAKETTTMIESSIKKVEAGTKIADETAQALNKIVEGVTNATNLVGGIASASNEQASGISQINMAIEQVAQVVQTNSATAEESAAASEELSGQSQILKDIVSKFTLRKMRGLSSLGNANLNPEVIGAIEILIAKNSLPSPDSINTRKDESVSNMETNIHLNDVEFGKYSKTP